MTRIATDPDQSRRILSCGVNPYTADMTHVITGQSSELVNTFFHYGCMSEDDAPAWSLSVLLALLPKEIVDEAGDAYYLNIAQDYARTDEYGVSYRPAWADDDELMRTHDHCPIEACVQMIEKLIQNGHKLNKL